MNGLQLWSEKVGLLYSFGQNDTIAGGETATVVAEYTGTPPAGFYDSGESNNVNWLPDGEGQKFDSIFLYDTVADTYIVLSYGQPPRTPTLPSALVGATRIGAGEQINSNSPNGVAFTRDANGNFTESSPDPGAPGVPCFCPGTLIETDMGPIPVEDLAPGMMLKTSYNSSAPLLAIRRFVLPARQVWHDPSLWPVTLPKGMFGAHAPLSVSPNHRILLDACQASLLFGDQQVLVAAKHLLAHGAVRNPYTGGALVYYHLLLQEHAILNAHGFLTESLFLGDEITSSTILMSKWNMSPGFTIGSIEHKQAAHMILRRHEVDVLMKSMCLSDLCRAA